MGVQGLWKLIEPSGRIVPLETMGNKILAVDVSIWLHQAMKGMHDIQGAPVAIAHLLVLFHRLCKLLFYKIKPVFVFDGGVPELKRQTMSSRRVKKSAANSEAARVRGKLLKNLLKHEALRHVLADQTASSVLGLSCINLPGPSEEEDLYKLPEVATQAASSTSSEGSGESSGEDDEKTHMDIYSVDVTSQAFKALPAEIRHDILSDIKDTRKQNSWRHIDQMPSSSQDFSDYQMNRLLKRRAVQSALEDAGKEVVAKDVSMQDLQGLLGDNFTGGAVRTGRLAQEDSTRYVLIQKANEGPLKETAKKEEPKTLIEESKGFNIAEHLDDVGWSSDSEVEVDFAHGENEVKIEESTLVKSSREDGNMNQIDINVIPKIKTENSLESRDKISGSVQEDKKVTLDTKHDMKDRSNTNVSQFSKLSESNKSVEDILCILEGGDDSIKSDCYSTISDQTLKTIASNSLDTIDKKDDLCLITKAQNPSIDVVQCKDIEEVKPLQSAALNLKSSTPQEQSHEADKQIDAFEELFNEKSESTVKSQNNTVVDKIIESNKLDCNISEQTEISNIESDSTSDDEFVVVEEPVEVAEVKQNEVDATVLKNEEESPVKIKPQAEEFANISAVDLHEELSREIDELLSERGRQARMAQSVTDQMYTDAQELLKLFGVPYIVAPMEAEAQCATLDLLGLTEGTITDDSDIWLFGGRTVYKNFFNQKKHVLEYRSDDIKEYFKLSREDMIKLALLVGSDYTNGVPGIGPVTALEILASFRSASDKDSFLGGLIRFRDWVSSGFVVGPTRISLKSKIKNVKLTQGFPSQEVVDGYLKPHIDDSEEPFSWAKPDVNLLQSYTKQRFGWSTDRCNECIMPVMKKLMETTDQTTIDKYFKVTTKPSLIEGFLSKRVEGAIKRLGRPADELPEQEPSTSRPKKPKIGNISTDGLDPTTYRLHQDTWIPQKDLEKKRKADLKKKAAELLRSGRGRGKNKRVFRPSNNQRGPALSESSSDEC